MPTLLEFAGAGIPDTVEGRSMLPLLRGESAEWHEYVHIEHAPTHHCLTDGEGKYIWFVADGREQFFRLTDDPTECHDLTTDPREAGQISHWRRLLVNELEDRAEGFSDGTRLIPGRPYPAVCQPGTPPS